MTKYIVFDPEASDDAIRCATAWMDEWEEAWDSGHIEIIDIQDVRPKRYIGNGAWTEVEFI